MSLIVGPHATIDDWGELKKEGTLPQVGYLFAASQAAMDLEDSQMGWISILSSGA